MQAQVTLNARDVSKNRGNVFQPTLAHLSCDSDVVDYFFWALNDDDGTASHVTVEIPSQFTLRDRDLGSRQEMAVLDLQWKVGSSNFDTDDIGTVPAELRFGLQRFGPIAAIAGCPSDINRLSSLSLNDQEIPCPWAQSLCDPSCIVGHVALRDQPCLLGLRGHIRFACVSDPLGHELRFRNIYLACTNFIAAIYQQFNLRFFPKHSRRIGSTRNGVDDLT